MNTPEDAGTTQFTVVLDAKPYHSVTFSAVSSHTNEGALSTSLLTYTTSNWNTAQTVVVPVVDDFVTEPADTDVSITISEINSDDTNFHGYTVNDVAVTISDGEQSLGKRDIRCEMLHSFFIFSTVYFCIIIASTSNLCTYWVPSCSRYVHLPERYSDGGDGK
jgi:hypothetical protein